MRTPRKRVAGIALLIVVLTIGITSPLLTMLSTILLPRQAGDPVLSTQLISLLAGKWGGVILQTEVAISASTLLIFASNTAIIGTYHVFMALARMDFFPPFILQRNKLRGTPHYSILLATGIPILILVLVFGQINILAGLYAFGLLGAFSLTCIGVDIVRFREHRLARSIARQHPLVRDVEGRPTTNNLQNNATEFPVGHKPSSQATSHEGLKNDAKAGMTTASKGRLPLGSELKHIWHGMNFWLGNAHYCTRDHGMVNESDNEAACNRLWRVSCNCWHGYCLLQSQATQAKGTCTGGAYTCRRAHAGFYSGSPYCEQWAQHSDYADGN
jgi:hypothetical protein